VTCFVDAGSVGADKIDDVVENARSAPNRGRVLINLSRTGVQPDGELNDLNRADVAAARAAIARHRDMIKRADRIAVFAGHQSQKGIGRFRHDLEFDLGLGD